jgi:hypothetical protein
VSAKILMAKKSCLVCFLLVAFGDISFANTAKPVPQPHRPNEPFASFSLLDAKLTEIDRAFGKFKEEAGRASKMPKKRTALKALHAAKSVRDLRASVADLQKITARLRSRYSRQRYAQRISSALDRKAVALRKRMLSLASATTWSATFAAERKFDTALLSFVLQYQAMSGGYAALACSPGDWTCCQPKNVSVKAGTPVHGCTWLCAKKASNCREGCLGPRIPVAPAHLRSK